MRLFCFLTLYLSYPSTHAKPAYFFYPDQATLSLKAASGYRYTNHLITNLIYTSIMRKYVLLALVFLTSFTAFAQDFSNKGMEFWTCFPNHIPSGAVLGQMTIWITSDRASSGTVTISNGSFSTAFTVAANGIVPINIPYANAHISNAESGLVIQKSIRIKVNAGQPPVVAYAQQYGNARSAATLLLPTNVLGKKYRAYSFTHTATSGGGQNSRSQFQIIATQPNTQVEVTPYANGVKSPTFTIVFPNVGDMYQYQAQSDVTGTLIESIASGSSPCLPVAVFSGNSAVTIGTNGPTCNGGSFDPLFQQMYPVTSWGKNFGFIPFGDYTNRGNPYRVMAAEDNTTVYFNGAVVANLNAGQIYPAAFTSNPVLLNAVTSITADKPISVAHYLQTSACSGSNNGDPDMVMLNPIEQNIKDITVFASTQQNINRQWINVLIQTTAAASFKIDGFAPTTAFVTAANIPGYSYLRHMFNPTVNGSHYLTADSGFNAILYGYQGGQFESYAYSAGTNVKDLSQELEIETTYGIETSPSVCTNSPFKFKVYFPDSTIGTIPIAIRFDSLRWNLSDPFVIIPNNFPIVYYGTVGSPPKVAIDSTNIRNGRQVNWYSLPTTYYFTTPPVDTLFVTGYTSTNEGCGNTKDYVFPIQINDPPTASFTTSTPGCFAEPVVATETTPQIPKPTYKQWWEFYDPVTNLRTVYSGNGVRVATHTFTTPGVKQIRYASITTPGCLSDTIVQNITLLDIPNATITGNTAVCINSVASVPVTFTGTDGTAEYIFSYNINGGATILTPPSTSGTFTIPAPTNVAGTFVYNLIGVRNQNPATTLCTRVITGQSIVVTINPLPTANISGTTSVCQNAAAPLITFTGAVGTAPYTFTYNINGGANQTITTVAGNSVTIAAPTTAVGTFNYNLVSVTDGSSTLCTQPQSGVAVIIVNPLPTANITGTTQVCKNAASPLITFTGADGTAPYTFTYNINGGANQTITTVAGNSVTIAAPTNVVGTFNYNLISVLDASSTLCTQAQTGLAVVSVNDLPTASIAGTITVCLNAASPNITFTGANTTAAYTFSYTINGGPLQTVTTVAGNSVTVPVPTNVAGTFTYDLVSVQDGSSTLCSQAQTGSAIVTVNPLPTAAIAGNTTVCKNAASPLITFTGAVGSAPYTFTYNINGGANQTVTTVAGNSVTVAAPTNVVGTFNYNLVSVREGSPNACSQAQPGTAVVTVNDLPTASISGTTEICLNEPSPLITFTGASTVAPYTFIYTINGGPNQTVTTVAGNSVTVAVPTNVAGLFTYSLVSVSDGSSTTCLQAQSGSAAVTVHPLPTANFNYAAPSCQSRTVSFTDASIPNIGTLTGWTWNFGDPGSGGNNTSTIQNPTHTFANAGPYTVTLIATSSKGCSNLPFTRTVNIDNRPQAGFIIPEVCLSDTYAQFLDTSKLTNSVIDRWDWNFGDPFATPANPNTSTLQNPTHSYTAVRTYNVRLIVWNFAKGCRDTITQVLQVNGSFPVANFTVNTPATLCANDSVGIVEASTVFPGVITKVEIYWDNAGFPAVFQTDNTPFTGKLYRHLYPNFQTPLTKVFTIRYRAYSGGVCVNDKLANITVNAAPRVQFNNIPNTCLLIAPFQITQASEIGGVPGSGVYSGPGVSATGLFTPGVAGIGTHTLRYTFTSTAAGCVDTMSNTITVLDTAHAAFSYVLPSCEQVPVSFTDLSTAPASVTLANTVWDFGDGTAIENHAPGSTFTHTFALPNTYTVIMYNVSAAGCLSTSKVVPITIDPNHSIALTTANNNQTVCINTNISQIKYNLGGGATNANVTGLPPGVTASVTGTQLTILGAPNTTVGGPTFTYNVETTGNTCVVARASGTITVGADHSISWNATSGNPNQTVCINTVIAPILYTLSGGATGATVTGLPAGITASVTGNQLTISGAPTTTVLSPFNFNIVTTGNACIIAAASGSITVEPDHSISWNATSGNPNQTVCINTLIAPVLYTLSGGATGASVTGLPAGITASVTGNLLTISGAPTTTVLSPFIFNIITTGNSCVLANAAGSIAVQPDHTITFNSGDTAQSVCINTPIDPIVYDLGGGATNVNISGLPTGVTYTVVGNILTISGTPTSVPATPGYTITTTGNVCLTASKIGEIVVHPYPVPAFTVDKPSYCIPNAIVKFTNGSTTPDGSGMTYIWNFGDGSPTVQSLNPTHWYTSEGPFNVRLSVTNIAIPILNNGQPGCTHDTVIVMNRIHPQPKADFVFSKPSICIGDNVVITDATDGKDGIVNQWNWNLGDGSTSVANPVTHTYSDTIAYTITMYSINSFGCNSDTVSKPFTVYPYPHVNAGPDKSVLEGGSVQLEATAFANDARYTWTPNLYLTDAGTLRPRVVSPKTDMTYRLTVTGRGGCQLSDNVFVKLLKFPVIPNTFTPNNDGRNDKWVISFLNTYPNNRVQIFTRSGNLVFESRGYNTPWDGTLKGKPLPFDTYYYIIEPGNGRDPITGYVTILK